MATAYTPGLKVAEATVFHKERRLPLTGEVCVAVGDHVTSEVVVARTALPGAVTPINLANRLGVEPRALPRLMQRHVGDRVAVGEVLATTPGFFGWFRHSVASPCAGVIDLVSTTTGQIMIRAADTPVTVAAYTEGVVESLLPGEGVVVRGYGAHIQGIFGIGGEVVGPLEVVARDPDQVLVPADLRPEHRGAIVVGGSLATHELLQAAVQLGVAGLVVGGIDDADLRAWLGYDLGVAITGNERLGLTLVITEGFGRIRMADKTFALLGRLRGRKTSMSGATQIRAGVLRPEIIVPWALADWPTWVERGEGTQPPEATTAETRPPEATKAETSELGATEGGERHTEATKAESPELAAREGEERPMVGAREGGERQTKGGGAMEPGSKVRLIREPHFGALATVTALPVEPQRIETEALVRVVTVAVAGNGELTVPRANVERIEG